VVGMVKNQGCNLEKGSCGRICYPICRDGGGRRRVKQRDIRIWLCNGDRGVGGNEGTHKSQEEVGDWGRVGGQN